MSVVLSEQEILRRNSLQKLQELGIDPYPAETFPVSHWAKQVEENFVEKQEVCMAGRLMGVRLMGKAAFAELQDSTGRMQIYVNRDELCPTEDKTLYNEVFKKLLDIGDFIGIKGYLFTTQTGEKSVHVSELTLLAKSLKPLPVVKIDQDGKVHDAFSDPELRYRQRYVDLVVNEKVRETFKKRIKITQVMRDYFNQNGYLEVETPILQPIPGGAAAKPFTTHHNALDMELYLRIAPELYLKRLIAGGFDGVYEFAKNFRNEGVDRTHNPEFTGMEIYVAYKDYIWMMAFTENLLERVAQEVCGDTAVQIGDKQVDFKAPYLRISIRDAILKYAHFDIEGKTRTELAQFCATIGIEVTESMGVGKLIDEIFGAKCEKQFVQPTFIIDYPVEMSPLTKKHRNNPNLTERFELIVNGKEIANAYTELNDPLDQRARFESQMQLLEKGDDEAMFIDQDFLRALEYGMPPTAGLGIGIDRLCMYLTNQESIQEVLFFPQLRAEKWAALPKASDFEAIGVDADWAEHLVHIFKSVEDMQGLKLGQLQQKLSEYRKKQKLELTLPNSEVLQSWLIV